MQDGARFSRIAVSCHQENFQRALDSAAQPAAALAFRALGTYADAAERSSDAWKQAVVHNHICGAEKFSLGVRADGSVIRTGSSLSFMENVVAVAAGGEHSVYLLADGRVTASGKNYHGETEVGDWTEIGIGNLQ
ncbi:MAG: hypothetical protein IJQ36_03440 [Oscillospiraceae bacterium]|nr:hypothetical protein [Oscillospiraceae bacterium]